MDDRVGVILEELKSIGDEKIKKIYMNHGAKEPLFGVRTGDLKPLFKKYKIDYELAKDLYDTNNYDAMYLAGMLADPEKMTEEDFEHWMKGAYCHGIGDYTVAITLAESPLGQKIADKWIKVDDDLYKSCGWYSYSAMLGNQPDENFDKEKISSMLDYVKDKIHQETNRTRYSMNSFLTAVGISYLPLHDKAVEVANQVGKVDVYMGKTACKTPLASEYIKKAEKKGRLGFKRKNVRC